MRRRRPLLRTVIALTAALVVAAAAILGLIRVPRTVFAEGGLVIRTPGIGPVQFDGVVDDRDGAVVRRGQRVAIRLDSYPWMRRGTLAGTVEMVGAVPLPGGGIPVIIDIEESHVPGPLQDGFRGEARIATGESESLGRLLFSRAPGGRP